MSDRIQIVGSFLSPYVRKVLVCLQLKGLAYEVDPIVPFLGDDRFSKLSPLRRIPVLIDDWVTLSDSSVICQYLEDRYPRPSLYPLDLADRAHARWLEEYADTRMGDVFIWKLFNQVAIRRAVWGEEPDKELLTKTLNEDIPSVLDYLEYEVPDQGFLYDNFCLADISLGSFFRNAEFSRFFVDAVRWPRTAAYVERVLSSEPFGKLAPYEDRCSKIPIAQHRSALAEMGAPLTKDTYGTSTPRPGI